MFRNNKINAFLALAETFSYTKAAKKLYMSQQAVSRCIASLEDELGAQLFIRTTRTVELTSAGRKYYNLYNQLNQEYDAGVARIRNETGESHRNIRIGVQSYMDAEPILNAIEAMKTVLPNFSIPVSAMPPSVLLDQFKRELVDLIIVLQRFLPDGFDAVQMELVVNPLYLMVSDKNPKATDDASFEDLMTLPYISDMLEGEDNLAHKARLKHEVENWNLVPDEILWTYDRDSALMYAELGYGIVIDSTRSRMMHGRALKTYYTGKTEALLLLSREEAAENPAMNLLIKALENSYHAMGK